MSFDCKYSVTTVFDDEKSKVGLSIDEFDNEVCPVILIIPDKNLKDHDHLVIKNEDMKNFVSFINRKTNKMILNRYELTAHEDSNNNLINLELYENDHGKITLLYKIMVHSDMLINIKEWLSQYEKYTQKELFDKIKSFH